MHAEYRQTHTDKTHKRRHRKKKTACVPPQPATRSKNKFPIASFVVPKSIECNTSMQMSSTENQRKENTLILCSVWRARSSDVRYRDVLHAAAVEVSVQGMSLQLAWHFQQISLDAHPLKPNKAFAPIPIATHLEQQREAPRAVSGLGTAPGRAAPMAKTPQEGTSCSSRRCPQWHPACTCHHTRTCRSIPVSVVSYRHSGYQH